VQFFFSFSRLAFLIPFRFFARGQNYFGSTGEKRAAEGSGHGTHQVARGGPSVAAIDGWDRLGLQPAGVGIPARILFYFLFL